MPKDKPAEGVPSVIDEVPSERYADGVPVAIPDPPDVARRRNKTGQKAAPKKEQ